MMKNKGELKKLLAIEIAAACLFLTAFFFLLYSQYRTYTKNFNERLGAALGALQEYAPEAEVDRIMGSMNEKTEDGRELLSRYGIDPERESVVLKNDREFRTYVLVDLSFLLLFFATCAAAFLLFDRRKDKKIGEITAYLGEINRGNYALDISDNSEEFLSILKNELYKTTVMLNETAENSRRDKLLLKDSLSDISHQLKTPLTSVLIMLDAMLDDPDMDGKTRSGFLRNMKREIAGTQFLVDSLLKLSKLDSNTVHFLKQETTAGEIVAEAVKNVEILAELKNVELRVEGSAEGKLFCDLKWQAEALTNIIKNGIEHSEENGTLLIAFGDNALYTEISVRDFGGAIAKEDLPHIFERFYKGKSSGQEGVGIGLALSKAIIEKDNGYVQAETGAGGSRFLIRYFH